MYTRVSFLNIEIAGFNLLKVPSTLAFIFYDVCTRDYQFQIEKNSFHRYISLEDANIFQSIQQYNIYIMKYMKFNFRLGKLACNELDNNTPITLHR